MRKETIEELNKRNIDFIVDSESLDDLDNVWVKEKDATKVSDILDRRFLFNLRTSRTGNALYHYMQEKIMDVSQTIHDYHIERMSDAQRDALSFIPVGTLRILDGDYGVIKEVFDGKQWNPFEQVE